MTSNNAENSLEIIEKRLDNYIKSIVRRQGYLTYKAEKRHLCTKGDNFLGILYEVNITRETNEGEKQTSLFVKNIIKIERMIFSLEQVFETEAFFYLELSKMFKDLQQHAKVPSTERFNLPRTYDETNGNAIVLENLTKRGFKTYNRMDEIDIDFGKLALKNLAKYHALSFVIQQRDPTYFESKIKTIKCVYYSNKISNDFTQNMVDRSFNYLDKNILEKHGKSILEKLNNYQKYMTDECCVRVLCHGDYRPNNIMVAEVNGKPSEVISVDYQIIHYGNPVLDLIYFIIWSTDQDFRKDHLTTLKDTYYNHMEEYLGYFEMDLKNIWPKVEFEQQFQEKLDFGMYIALVFLPFLFYPEEDVPAITDVEEKIIQNDLKVDPKFVTRLNGIFKDYVKWGYLK